MNNLELVSEEKDEVEKTLDTSTQHLEFMIESLPLILWQIDKDEVITAIYGQAIEKLRFTPEDIIGSKLTDLYPDHFPVVSYARKALQGASPNWIIETNEIFFESYYHPIITNGKITGAMGLAIDITDQEKIKTQLELTRKSLVSIQRMELLGSTLSKMSHDLNNKFTVILGYLQLISENPEMVSTYLPILSQYVNQASQLPQTLLAYTSRPNKEETNISPVSVLEELTPILDKITGEQINFTYKIHPDIDTLPASAIKLESIITNLVSNAADAIESTGFISLTLDFVSNPDTLTDTLSGEYIRLTVTDTGSGIDPVTQSKIFEPLFSTKSPEKGSGLGLSIVSEMVDSFNGGICVNSKMGEGTSIEVFIPTTSEVSPDSFEETKQEMDYHIPEQDLSIVVVDDDRDILNLIVMISEDFAKSVLTFSDPIEALTVISNRNPPVDIFLVDMVMPDFDGIAFAKRVKPNYLDAKFILMSGYASMKSMVNEIQDADFISKPFTPQELKHVIGSFADDR